MESQQPEHDDGPVADEAPPPLLVEPPAADEPKNNFYSVFVPGDTDCNQRESEADKYIFEDKNEAMTLVKNRKKARFRLFGNYQEAHRFASYGVVETPHKTKANLNMAAEQEDFACSTPPMIADKVSLFKGPKPQDLVKLRKCIETGNGDLFRKLVWENPRFLVSSGDTPSILHEGFRYNALHVSTRWQNAQMTDLVLSTISDYNFIRFLYGDDDPFNTENRIQVLLDLYLNTPDRGVNETPLHFACKFAAADVVEVLVSYSQCDKTVKNKYGLTPYDIIMDRYDLTRKVDKAALKKKLQMLLTNEYYVPVLRAEDNSIMPVVGVPFSIGNSPRFIMSNVWEGIDDETWDDSTKQLPPIKQQPVNKTSTTNTCVADDYWKFVDIEAESRDDSHSLTYIPKPPPYIIRTQPPNLSKSEKKRWRLTQRAIHRDYGNRTISQPSRIVGYNPIK